MGLADMFRRGGSPGPRLAPFAPGEGALSPAWTQLDGLPLETLGAAALRDAEAAATLRLLQTGPRPALDGPRRDPAAAPPGPRRGAFSADQKLRPSLGAISDRRSLTPPWAAVCQIEARFKNGRAQGTGFRIGPHLVLTAAHMLLRPDLGEAEAIGLYFHNGADQPQRALSFEVSKEWRASIKRQEAGAPPLARDDFGVVFVADHAPAPPTEPFCYLPIQATNERWFAERPAARYRLIGAPAGEGAVETGEGYEPHRLYEKTDFVWTGLPRRLREALDQSPAKGGARRFGHCCVRHRIDAPPGFSGAPLLAALPDPWTNSFYEAAVGLHLGAAEGFGAARIIDEELKRRLLIWSRQAQRMIEDAK